MDALTPLQAFLASSAGLAVVGVLVVLTLLFLALWLRARGGGGKGDSAARQDLRAAQNEARLAKGDLVQAKRDHEAQLARLSKELETLRAVAGGQVPPELEEWKRRALDAEGRLQSEIAALTERHKQEVQILEAALGKSSVTGTIIAPSSAAARERMDRLEKDLAEAQRQIEAMTAEHKAELAALADRLGAEKAAALTALAEKHAAELRAAGGRPGAVAAAGQPLVDTASLASSGDLPDSARFPFLEVVAGERAGQRYFLPYGVTTLGRSDASTIMIDDTLVSRNHAEIGFNGVDFQLKDNNSTNGSFLNEKAVSTARLDFGDVVGIGELKLRFGCAGRDSAAGDPGAAIRAYEAMIRLAPSFRAALRDLADLLEADPARTAEVQALRERLAALEGGQAA